MSAKVEYELDASGSLMEQVQALIAPPQSEDAAAAAVAAARDRPAKKSNHISEHPYFKRPGKGHNHDLCDACGEGGDLICCDRCPSSFHLQCHDPPLEITDIPTGQWLCHSCRYTTGGKRVATPSVGKIAKKVKPGSSSLDVLVEAAKAMNPRQFELPRNMQLPCLLPGTDKDQSYMSGRRNSRHHQKQSEKNQTTGLIPLPAKKCHECRKSCRVAPLIACDYCPLLFHLDCLNPPLATPPTCRWMCPNHVEHALDTLLLKSVSLTERVKLWDRFASPVDQDAVKLDFFRKVHRKNPPFRIKVRLPAEKYASVPAMVREHYRKPVELLPSLRDVLRLRAVHADCFYGGGVEVKLEPEVAGFNSEELCYPDDLGDDMVNGRRRDDEFDEEAEVKSEGSGGATVRLKQEGELCNGSFGDYTNATADAVNSEVESQLRQLDERLLKLLAYQRVQQLIYAQQQHPKDGCKLEIFGPPAANNSRQQSGACRMPLPSELLTPADIDRISRVFATPKKKSAGGGGGNNNNGCGRQKSCLRARAMLCPVVSKHFYNVRTTEVDPADVRHDASFMGYRPTVSARFPEAAAMRYRVLNVGKGCANDVELDRYGHCNHISPKHAVIYFDEFTKQYELINYAAAGTYVNNVFYGNDAIERAKPAPPSSVSGAALGGATADEKKATLEMQVREIIDKKRKVARQRKANGGGGGGFDGKMAAIDCADRMECSCGGGGAAAAEERPKSGWEGPAVLNHGALLRFGCISFVFSVVDCSV